MIQPRSLTIAEYASAFETWSSVSRLSEPVAAVLAASLAHLRAKFADDESRGYDVYCAAFDEFLGEYDEEHAEACRRLRVTIKKSCLLDRLLRHGEALRSTRCPVHNGRWSGIHMEPCPHGCSIGCGCTTGWIPSTETVVRSYVEMCMMFDVVNENATRLRDALDVVTEERDEALRRARVATQTIVAEIGADGPMSVEDAASKAVAAIVAARGGSDHGVDG